MGKPDTRVASTELSRIHLEILLCWKTKNLKVYRWRSVLTGTGDGLFEKVTGKFNKAIHLYIIWSIARKLNTQKT